MSEKKTVEEMYHHKVTKRDINETVAMLSDFGISIKKDAVPNFVYFNELASWRRGQIQAHLNLCSGRRFA